jgi:hypothetical protein
MASASAGGMVAEADLARRSTISVLDLDLVNSGELNAIATAAAPEAFTLTGQERPKNDRA